MKSRAFAVLSFLTTTSLLALACGDDEAGSASGSGGSTGVAGTSTAAGTGTVGATATGSSGTGDGGDDAVSSTSGAGKGGEGGEGGGVGGAGVGGAGTGGASSGDVDADYCTPLATLLCERAVDCGCGEALPGDVLDLEACVGQYRQQCIEAYAVVDAAVDSGDAFVDAEAASDCIDAFDDGTPPCEQPRGTIPFAICPTWFWSFEEQGDDCTFPYCAGGDGYCDAGTCAPRPEQGDACDDEYMCATGLLCLDGQCTPPLGLDAKCDDDVACLPPLYCSFGVCATALRAEGEACDETASCSQGLSCEEDGDVDRCAAPSVEPCTSTAECGNLALCAVPRVCLVPGDPGSTCSDDAACAPGSRCDTDISACVSYPALGEDCANGTFCAAGLACSEDFGECVELPGDGEACLFGPNGPFACEEALGCIDGTCGPLPAEDEPCASENRCADGLGCAFGPDGSFCVVPAGVGTTCENDGPCEADLHCDFTVGECAEDFATGEPCSSGNECAPGDICGVGPGGSFACLPAPEVGDACVFDCDEGLGCTIDGANAVCVPSICLAL